MAWGKCDKNNIENVHLLEHHCADVASCFEAILARDAFNRVLASAAGKERLSGSIVAKLACLVFLHDFGKLNSGFQFKVRGEQRKLGSSEGHVNEAIAVVQGESELFQQIMLHLQLDKLVVSCGESIWPLLLASLSHHGRPVNCHKTLSNRCKSAWEAHNGYDPVEQAKKFGMLALKWYPEAFENDGGLLPDNPPFQHAFAGAVSLVDWLGSDEALFPFVKQSDSDYIVVARKRAVQAVKNCLYSGMAGNQVRNKGSFAEVFGFAPNRLQQHIAQIPSDIPLLIVESDTGSGKTEAAFERFCKLYCENKVDGMYFALPTRSAAVQIHGRIDRAVKQFFKPPWPETVLAVPGYLKVGTVTGQHLPEWRVKWDDEDNLEMRALRWAAENSKRYLSAQVAVGTVDQAMLAAMEVKHSHLRAFSLARSLLVIDEVHASDIYMRSIIARLLKNHVTQGGHVLLMSATLGSDALRSWLLGVRAARENSINIESAVRIPYPSVAYCQDTQEITVAPVPRWGREKIVSVRLMPFMDNHSEIAAEALARAAQGAKVLIVRNTVKYAVRTQEALERHSLGKDGKFLFKVNGVRTMHHGRYGPEDRVLLDDKVAEVFGKQRSGNGRIVVGTQTLEQSLDIDADFLITDVCPVDVLLQRIGRLHRHERQRPEEFSSPQCCVLVPQHGFSAMLEKPVNGLGIDNKGNGIYLDLRCIEATRKLIERHSEWRIPEMNRYLVEKGTKNEVLDEIARQNGNDWEKIWEKVTGKKLADGSSASFATVNWCKGFKEHDVVFSDNEAAIRTRLGEEGPAIDFAPPFPGPFGKPVSRLSVPAWMSSERLIQAIELKQQPVWQTLDNTEGSSCSISLGDKRFHYGRMGLSDNSD